MFLCVIDKRNSVHMLPCLLAMQLQLLQSCTVLGMLLCTVLDTTLTLTYFLASRQNPAVLQVVLPGEVRDFSQFRLRRMH